MTDPWDLLKEARALAWNTLESNKFEENEPDCLCKACEHYRQFIARIDAALAERQDSATDVVEWDEGENYEGKHWWDTMIGDRAVHVEAWDKGGTRFYWRVFSTLDEEGHQPTLDEAKSAAVKVARGLK